LGWMGTRRRLYKGAWLCVVAYELVGVAVRSTGLFRHLAETRQ
jgi:hypothetical protein